VAPPPPPRYPLYADEVVGYTPYGPLNTATTTTPAPAVPAAPVTFDEIGTPQVVEPAAPAEPEHEPYQYEYYEERRSPVLWILVAALVLVLVAAGWWFLVRDHADHTATDGAGTSQGPDAKDDGVDVAGRASARAPETAPPSQDVNGDQVSYDASNMLDGVPETAWRTPGNATDMTLTFTLADPTELHQVGLINGYAKTSTDDKGQSFDWYALNRRINAVVWEFDDGTKVRQQLKDGRDLQMTDVPDVVTSKVLRHLLRVTKPGSPGGKDFTAISEVSMVGDPA
jgi:hypothetical protein